MIAAAGLLLASCGINTEPKTAEDCAEAYIDAMKSFDAEAMGKLSLGWADLDEEEQKERIEAIENTTDENKKQIKEKFKKAKVLEVEETGEDRARARIEVDGEKSEMRMRKEDDGVWRIIEGASF